jgi:hypothetical protein
MLLLFKASFKRRSSFWSSSRLSVIVCLVTVLIVGTSGRSAIVEYNDASSFAAALEAGAYFNNFTGAGSGSSLSYTGPSPTLGPFRYTISASGSFGVTGVEMAIDSGLGLSVSTFEENAQLTITFTGTNKPTAIGGNFFWSDLSSPANVVSGTIRADFNIGGSTVYTLDIASSTNTSIGFGGVTTDGEAFDSVTLTLLDYVFGDFFPTIDNFQIGRASPGPSQNPSLTIFRSGNQVTLQWPDVSGFNLEFKTNLLDTTWFTNTVPPTLSNGVNSLTMPPVGTRKFFRLHKP